MVQEVQAVIFDFDGLLMDTESTNVRSWEDEWGRWGLTLDRSAFFVPHGGDVTEHRYHQLANAVGEEFDLTLSRGRRTRRRDELNSRLRLAAGIEAWLTSSSEAGLRTAVASSSDASWVQHLLEGIAALDAFEVVVGGDSVDRPKPAPDVYQLALERLALSADEAIAVEDSPHGVDAAHAAGLACVAIPNPFVEEVAIAHADVVLGSAKECTLVQAIRRATTSAGARARRAQEGS